ncbi:hypothetical protein RHSIM_Rhsim02G0222600 [Rhododendron simsii]|uniref:Uncharacterized protein n=1 Tax=Rhododendron simsii TaxID=118357 RepID=A0A834HD83_RHOSS|nr:hypothetical protein RHSIM_Rhsim02G0222600 [Rhododendron simsii]
MHDSKVVPVHPWKEKLSTVYIVVGTIVAITLPILLVFVIFYVCWRTRTHVNPQEADGPEPAVATGQSDSENPTVRYAVTSLCTGKEYEFSPPAVISFTMIASPNG